MICHESLPSFAFINSPTGFFNPKYFAAVSLRIIAAESDLNDLEKSRPMVICQFATFPKSYVTLVTEKSDASSGSLPLHVNPPTLFHTSVSGLLERAISDTTPV